MKVQIERWFLRGGPLYVSVLVIVLSVLRVFQFGYISTILDALPFGTIFGMATGTGRDLGMLCIDRCCRRTGISGLANWLLVTRSTHFFVVTGRDL